MTNLGGKQERTDETSLPGQSARTLHDAFDTAEKFFWCNTNRGAEPRGAGPHANELENRMHERGVAAAWTPFDYPEHMKRVRRAHLIVMYANGRGVIGIGRAKESRLEILGPDHPDRIREFIHGQHEEEWRVPVEWCVWDEKNPCQIEPLRKSFQELRNQEKRLKEIRKHFLEGS